MNSPSAYSYIRMSTDLQMKGDSLRRQAELSRAYADKHGLRLVPETELQDIGVSAFKGANVSGGALGDFLKKAKNGDIPRGSYLLVESLDRISRQDILSSLNLLMEIIGLGINVVTLQDERKYSKEEVDMTSLVVSISFMSRAHEESLIKSQRVRAAWESKRNRIADQKLTKICPAWLRLSVDRKEFIAIEDRCEIIRRIFRETEQGMGSYLITKRLNQEGIPPIGPSKLWGQSYVTKILQNRAVIGEYQPQIKSERKRRPTGSVIHNYFPRIIDEGLFYRVQQLRKSRAGKEAGRRGEFQRNLFTNIAKCGYCQSSMRLINKGAGPKGGIYLKCSRAISGGECVKTSWRYDEFEKSFLYIVREIDLDAVVNASAHNQARQEWAAEYEGLASKRRYEELARDRLMELLSDERQDFAYLQERLAQSAEVIRKIQFQMETLPDPSDDQTAAGHMSASEILSLIDSVQSKESVETRVRLAAHLKKLIEAVYLKVEGNPTVTESFRQLVGDRDDDFTRRLMANAEEWDSVLEKSQPSFLVMFADGRSRSVSVRRGDPTKILVMNAGATLATDGAKRNDKWGDLTEDGFYVDDELQDRSVMIGVRDRKKAGTEEGKGDL